MGTYKAERCCLLFGLSPVQQTNAGILTDENDIARNYRQRAEELRSVACTSHADIQQALLRIADNYDLMADSMARIAQTNKALQELKGVPSLP